MSALLEELFILIEWEDGKSLVCPISKIVAPKKDAGEYCVGERVLAKRPRLGNKHGVISAIHEDHAWLKSLKSEVDTPRTAQNGHSAQLSKMQKSHDSCNEKQPISTKETTVLSPALKASTAVSSISYPEKPASKLESSVSLLKKPVGRKVSSISPPEKPAGQTKSSIYLPEKSASRKVSSTIPSKKPARRSVSSISSFETPACRKRIDSSSNMSSASDGSLPKKLCAGVSASEPLDLSPLTRFSEPTETNVAESELLSETQTMKSSCENSPTSLEPVKLERSISDTSEESDDVAGFVSMKEFKNLQRELEDLKYQLNAMKQMYEKLEGATSGEELKKMMHFETDIYKELMRLATSTSTLTEAVKSILLALFSIEELSSCSLKGKHTNKNYNRRSGLDERRRNLAEAVLSESFKVGVNIVRMKIRDRLKIIRKSHTNI